MPQDFTVGADNQQINKQRLDTLKKQAQERGEVFPYDTVTVHATKTLVDSKFIPEINKVGHPFEVHSAVADKLIASGKATKEAPKDVPKLAVASEVIDKINAAKSVEEAKSFVTADDTRTTVKDALNKKLAELNK